MEDDVEQLDGVESVASMESGESIEQQIEQPQETENGQQGVQNEILAAVMELKSQMSHVFQRMDGYERGDTGRDSQSDPENPRGSDIVPIQPQDSGAENPRNFDIEPIRPWDSGAGNQSNFDIEPIRPRDSGVPQEATSDPLFRNVQVMARAADRPTDNGAALEVTADSLHRNVQIMARAAERLAQFGANQVATNEGLDINFGRGQGKKSGSQLLASDAIQSRIDWPHFYARRMSAGRRKQVHYCDLKPEEFTHGFLAMINAQKSVFNREIMLALLENLMQDATDFGWDNARDFYEMLGIDVERGQLRWEESNTIHTLRMTYCRTIFPDKKPSKEGQKGPTRAAPPGTRCRASYQRKACDQQRDHPPFTHACSYCLRTCSTLYRHAEDECYRKINDEAKNAKGRE